MATGEQCQNRIVFKQLMAAGGVHFVQIDSCRVAGVNEIILILLLAKKFNLPVCPHAGGVGKGTAFARGVSVCCDHTCEITHLDASFLPQKGFKIHFLLILLREKFKN